MKRRVAAILAMAAPPIGAIPVPGLRRCGWDRAATSAVPGTSHHHQMEDASALESSMGRTGPAAVDEFHSTSGLAVAVEMISNGSTYGSRGGRGTAHCGAAVGVVPGRSLRRRRPMITHRAKADTSATRDPRETSARTDEGDR